MKSITDLLKSSLIIPGDTRFAYRDPAALYHDGLIYLFFTLVETEPNGEVRMYVAQSDSHDLVNWSKPRKLTVRDPSKNFSSPGNIIYTGGRYIMCMQTYCRENGEKYGNANCRVYFAESIDLENWSEPYPVLLKGDHVPLGECNDDRPVSDMSEEKALVLLLQTKRYQLFLLAGSCSPAFSRRIEAVKM